ncbi:uncharacterized protein LOC124542549 [Vanessa cardui]|uniref:uncharacterized protein LOC124542549 n=1 Tax=Vanessa cardui TaxID=171605 RepID=UPI001F144435|nr:uncharacterized protein LOC124542549 [Vanessa cardui]
MDSLRPGGREKGTVRLLLTKNQPVSSICPCVGRAGGGRSDIPPPGPLQGQVEVLLGPTLDGLENPYDSDVQFIDQGLTGPKTLKEMITKSDVIVTDSQIQTILDVNAATSSQTSQDSTQEDKGCTLQTNEIKDDNILTEDNVEKNNWSSWTPKVLKTKMSNILSANKENNPSTWLHRRRPKTSLQDKVLQSKLELIETMKRRTQTDAALKELILQEQLKQEKLKTEKLQLEPCRRRVRRRADTTPRRRMRLSLPPTPAPWLISRASAAVRSVRPSSRARA